MKIVDTETMRECVEFLVYTDEALYLQGPRCKKRRPNNGCAADCDHLESLHTENDNVEFCLVCEMNAEHDRTRP